MAGCLLFLLSLRVKAGHPGFFVFEGERRGRAILRGFAASRGTRRGRRKQEMEDPSVTLRVPPPRGARGGAGRGVVGDGLLVGEDHP